MSARVPGRRPGARPSGGPGRQCRGRPWGCGCRDGWPALATVDASAGAPEATRRATVLRAVPQARQWSR